VYAFNKDGSIYDYFLGKGNTTNIKTFVANNNFQSEDLHMAANNKAPYIQAYPNPVYDRKIHLQLNNIPTGNYNITLYNMRGETLYSQSFQPANSTSITIDLKNAAAGFYKIRMCSNSNCYYTTVLLQ
jgi:hypothetical protein